jgi:hypothetical protein
MEATGGLSTVAKHNGRRRSDPDLKIGALDLPYGARERIGLALQVGHLTLELLDAGGPIDGSRGRERRSGFDRTERDPISSPTRHSILARRVSSRVGIYRSTTPGVATALENKSRAPRSDMSRIRQSTLVRRLLKKMWPCKKVFERECDRCSDMVIPTYSTLQVNLV